jgi:tetratricopeptide (TPR) repeat protein
MLGLLECYHFGDRALETTHRMEQFGVKAWRVTADQIRTLYHSLRGESNEAKTYFDRVELNAVQGAHTWQTEIFWPALLLNADVLTGDVMAARRRYVQLERRSQEVATLKPQAQAAHAAYLLLRGDIAEAVSLYEELLPGFPIRRCVAWETTRAYFARALNAAGEHERARAVANDVVENMVPEDHEHVAHFLESRRQLALAESGLGNHLAAAALLDELLARHGHEDNALLVGLLHQARAEVAERANDPALAEKHRAEMESRFRKTRNPLLIAECERTRHGVLSAVRARREAHRQFSEAPSTFGIGAGGSLTAATVEALPASGSASHIDELLRASDDPFASALEFVMRKTNAKSVFLYLLCGNELRLGCSTTNTEPPAPCVMELGRWLEAGPVRADLDSIPAHTATIPGYLAVALQPELGGSLVGGLILEAGPNVDLVGSTYVFDALGRAIEAHGLGALGFITA